MGVFIIQKYNLLLIPTRTTLIILKKLKFIFKHHILDGINRKNPDIIIL